MSDDLQTENYKSNPNLDKLIFELKQLLEPVQLKKQDEFHSIKWPVGIIVGNPRSGSTLLLQWVASLGSFSYPSNVLTRFAYAPYIGALIQKMLFDPRYDYHSEFKDIHSEINFESDQGKSKGALATNEFQHFFKCYLPNKEQFAEYLDENALKNVDISGLRSGLASIEYGLEKPFFTKGTFIQFNIDHFHEKIPELFFVMIKRDPLFIMQSLMISREQYYGTREKWFSVKPLEYKFLKKMDVYHQIAGQVYFTDKAILKGLETVPESNKFIINYEDFCNSPAELYENLVDKYNKLGYSITNPYCGPNHFECKNQLKLTINELNRFKSAYNYFHDNDH